jgi:hypothetical protein
MMTTRYGNKGLKQNRQVVFPASPPFFGLGGENSRGKLPNGVVVSTAKGAVLAIPQVGGLHHRYTRRAA